MPIRREVSSTFFSHTALIVCALAAVMSGATQPVPQPVDPAQGRPLPEPGPFLENVRRHLRSDRALLSQYTYLERDVERRLNDKGGVSKEETRVSEVYPALEEDDVPYRRTITIDGKPVAPADLDKKDAERRRKVLAQQESLRRESESDRQKRLARERERDRKEQETTDEILRIFDVKLLAREMIAGRAAILCSVTPRAGYTPRTSDGRILKKFSGRAWFDEDDYELVRADIEAADDLTFGFGVLARMHKGSRFQLRRRKINNEIWLPAELTYRVSARIALFKRIRAEGVSSYSDYKKFTAQTSTTFSIPKEE